MSLFGSGASITSTFKNQPTNVQKLINQTAAGQSNLLKDSNKAYQAGKTFQGYDGELTAGTNATEQAGIDALAGIMGGPPRGGGISNTGTIVRDPRYDIPPGGGGPMQAGGGGLNEIQGQINQVGGIDRMLANNPEMIEKLYNPFQQDVIDPTLSDMDVANQRQVAQRGLAAGKAGAFGGSRAGVADALAGGEYARAVAAASGGLRKEGFDTAAGLATKDLDRAATGDRSYMATLSDLYGTKGNLGINQGEALLAAGKQTRTTDQAGLDAAYQQFLQKRDWPWTNIQRQQDVVGQRDPAAMASGGQQTTNPGDPGLAGTLLGTLTAGTGAGIGAYLACDARLKTEVRRVGTLPSGAGIFRFRYHTDAPGIVREGPIAQDMARFVPDAVAIMADGMLAVRVAEIR